MQGQTSIVMQAPAEAVYDYVLDFSKHPEWNYQPAKVTKTSVGPIGVGSTFETVERAPENTPWLFNKLFVPLFTFIIGTKQTLHRSRNHRPHAQSTHRLASQRTRAQRLRHDRPLGNRAHVAIGRYTRQPTLPLRAANPHRENDEQ